MRSVPVPTLRDSWMQQPTADRDTPSPAPTQSFRGWRTPINVAKQPTSGNHFNWRRAQNHHCVEGVKYQVWDGGEEAAYIINNCALLICEAANSREGNCKLHEVADRLAPLIDTGELKEALTVLFVEYGQLKPIPKPDVSQRPREHQLSYIPELEYDIFKGRYRNREETYVQAPSFMSDECQRGKYFKVMPVQGLPMSFRVVLEVKSVQFYDSNAARSAVELTYGYGKDLVPENQKRQLFTHISFGYYSDVLSDFKSVGVSENGQFVHKFVFSRLAAEKALFFQYQGHNYSWPKADVDPEPAVQVMPLEELAVDDSASDCSTRSSSNKFALVDIGGKMAHFKAGRTAKESYWVTVSNFVLVKILNVYQFDSKATAPYDKILCRSIINPELDTCIYLSVEDNERWPDLTNCGILEVEVLVQTAMLRANHDVDDVFSRAHSNLRCSSMTPEMLRCWIVDQPVLPVSRAVDKFGCQSKVTQDDSTWVFGNCAVKGGEYRTLDQVAYSIVPSFFAESNIPMQVHEFPRLVVIPQPHVRMHIGCYFWKYLMPEYHLNNEMAAKAAFAAGVMGLYATNLYGAQGGLGRGMPITWLYSAEPSTGKTQALLNVQGLLGFNHVSPWSGGSTRSAIFERLTQTRNLTQTIDDKNSQCARDEELKEITRAVYDQVSRNVHQKTRVPTSSLMYSSNQIMNLHDKAQQSRIILINFKKLDEGAMDPMIASHMNTVRGLLSCLLPDLSMLLYQNKLDSKAIGDCSTYLHGLALRNLDRNVHGFSRLLYFMILLDHLFDATKEQRMRTFEWVGQACCKASMDYNSNPSMVDQFLVAVRDARELRSQGTREDEVIGHHNMRSRIRQGNRYYYAFRLQSIISVLKKLLHRHFDYELLLPAIRDSDYGHVGSCRFYDTRANEFPIVNKVFDSMSNSYISVPTAEDQLKPEQMSAFACVYILKSKYEDATRCFTQPVIDSIEFEKSFFSDVIEGKWFGFRAIKTCKLSRFCGVTNSFTQTNGAVYVDTRVEDLSIQQGHGSLEQAMHIEKIARHYDQHMPDIDQLPACFRFCPIKGRDAPGDDPLENQYTDEEAAQYMRNYGSELDMLPDSLSECDDNELTETTPAPKRGRGSAGSIPRTDPSRLTRPKRRKLLSRSTKCGGRSRFILDEAENSDDADSVDEDEGEEV